MGYFFTFTYPPDRNVSWLTHGTVGMTEVTCGSIIQSEPRDDGTIGNLIPNNKLKLVDDDGNEVGFDTPGEMCIQAPNVMLGYWKNEAATREALTNDGWLRTGDVAIINKEGFIWIVDRKKEVCIEHSRDGISS